MLLADRLEHTGAPGVLDHGHPHCRYCEVDSGRAECGAELDEPLRARDVKIA
jgi:hypothetical protein